MGDTMPTKLFASMGFPISAAVFLLIIVIMYISKKKFNTMSNNIFLFLLVLFSMAHWVY